jgi:transposase InsO family protein
MKKTDLRRFTSWLGKRSYNARLERLGLERIQEIARENGMKPCHHGRKRGRPPKKKSVAKGE